MIWVVVPAAGSGRRFGAPIPKQYAMIGDKPLLEWTLRRLAGHPQIGGLMVVLSAHDEHWPNLFALNGKPVLTTNGGAERADSVINGLRALPAIVDPQDFVLVHDAARPCVRRRDITRLLELTQGSEGGLLAAPLRDTLKQAAPKDDAHPGRAPTVLRTLPREGLWRALTPQMFRRGALTAALQVARAGGLQPTDEAAAMEAIGVHPVLVEGAEDNLKVTTAQDLLIAQLLLTGAMAESVL